VLVQDPGSLVSGDDVTIEERSAAELLEFHGRPLVAEDAAGLACRYPAFDMTPASLISSLVGFDDLFTPESWKKYLRVPSTTGKNGSQPLAQYLLVYGVPSKQTTLLDPCAQGRASGQCFSSRDATAAVGRSGRGPRITRSQDSDNFDL
jgi:hypothetical protein